MQCTYVAISLLMITIASVASSCLITSDNELMKFDFSFPSTSGGNESSHDSNTSGQTSFDTSDKNNPTRLKHY